MTPVGGALERNRDCNKLAGGDASLTGRGEMVVTAETLRARILRDNAAFNAGERTFVADLLHEEIEWRFFISKEALPIPERVKGKWHVLLALQKIDAVIAIERNEIPVLLVDGDRAAMICERTVRQRASGRVMQYKIAAFHRYQDNKLIEYQEFGDALDLLEQALGRGIDAPAAYG